MQLRWMVVGLALLLGLGVVGAVEVRDGGSTVERAFGAVEPSDDPAESPLVGAPDVDGGTSREVYLRDPKGQVDRIAAGGDFVAWAVRTPADRIDHEASNASDLTLPVSWPASSRVIVADESGGARLAIDYPGRWIAAMRMIDVVFGQTKLAIRSCGSRSATSCKDELLTLAEGYPPTITARTSGAFAKAAVDGTFDHDAELVAEPKEAGKCLPRLVVRNGVSGLTDASASQEPDQKLPPLPETDGSFTKCHALSDLLLVHGAAFATVDRSDPKGPFDASIVYGIDLSSRGKNGWHEVARPVRISDGSYGLAVGPAVGLNGLFWEEFDTEYGTSAPYDLNEVEVPRDVRISPTYGTTPNTSEPIAPGTQNICAIAATAAAIYELTNPRCAFDRWTESGGAEIRRVVNPVFKPAED